VLMLIWPQWICCPTYRRCGSPQRDLEPCNCLDTRARRGRIPYTRQDRFTSARLVHFTQSQQRCKYCKTHSCHASIITCISLGRSNQIQPRSTNHSPRHAKNQHPTSRTHLASQAEQARDYTPFLPHRARPSALRLTSEVMSHT
jgi:hypothetical protein